MVAPNRSQNDIFDRDLQREICFNTNDLNAFIQLNQHKLITEQKYVYETIMEAINHETGGFYFLDAPGGTGKTFLLSLLLAKVRCRNEIALAVASSGIAATLLDGGRTAHSAFKLPLNLQLTETPTCNLSKNSGMGKVLRDFKIIVWDECTMAHKKALEALNNTLQDIRENRELFGVALLLLAGPLRARVFLEPIASLIQKHSRNYRESF